jgi:phosphoglycolate phosphatase
MRPTVLLFDIDGTLVTTGGAGRRAMERAFAQLHGRPDVLASFSFAGMTDRAIVRRGLGALGVPSHDEAIDALLAAYLAQLAHEVEQVAPADYRLHPGVSEAVAAACARAGFAVGLGTGNVREGARVKLQRVGIFERFAFGGFGCDHEERAELLRCGARRGAERLGVALDACRVVVIGDTPRDVEAARDIGAHCIGVATGPYSSDALREAGADYTFPHLGSAQALRALLDDD